jgi:uncharacterized membrane protein YqiK
MTPGCQPGILRVFSVVVPTAMPVLAVAVIVAIVTIRIVPTMIVINVLHQAVVKSAHVVRRSGRDRRGLRPWQDSGAQQAYDERDRQQIKVAHAGFLINVPVIGQKR